MRFAIRNADDRAAETSGEQDARGAAAPDDAEPNGSLDATSALALYEEYLNELDKVPTLRDPVVPETSGQHFDLDEKVREIVRDELAKLHGQSETPKRGSSRSRKRRKR